MGYFGLNTGSKIRILKSSIEIHRILLYGTIAGRDICELRNYNRTLMRVFNDTNNDVFFNLDFELNKPLTAIVEGELDFRKGNNSTDLFSIFYANDTNKRLNTLLNVIITNKEYIVLSHSSNARIIRLFINGMFEFVEYGSQSKIQSMDFKTDDSFPNYFSREFNIYKEDYKELNIKRVYIDDIPKPAIKEMLNGILIKADYYPYDYQNVNKIIIAVLYEYEE